MRKNILFLATIFFFGGILFSQAQEKKTTPKKEPAAKKEVSAPKTDEEKKIKLSEEKKAELNNTSWVVRTGPWQEGVYTDTDVLYFSEGKVVSRNFQNKGYPASGYSLTVQPNNNPPIITWELIQTDEKSGDQVSWRGDWSWSENLMRGGFSEISKKTGTRKNYSFVSTGWSKIDSLPLEMPTKPELKEETEVETKVETPPPAAGVKTKKKAQ